MLGAAAAQPAEPAARFDGSYVALGASYGITEPVEAIDLAFYRSFTLHPRGASFAGAAGYNFQRGRFVAGLEFAGRFGEEAATRAGVFTERYEFVTLANTEYQRMGTSASLHASLRAGTAIGNTLLFVKAGVGGAELTSVRRSSIRSDFCGSTAWIDGVLTCTSFNGGSFTSSFAQISRHWYASAVAGAGIEYDYRRLFVRLEGEGEAVFEGAFRQEVFWIARTKLMVGVRF